MRILSMEEMSLVVGGGRLDSADHDGSSSSSVGGRDGSGGSSSSSGASDRGKGSGMGAKDGYSFDKQVDASKSSGNNPGFKDSLIGKVGQAIANALGGGGGPDYGSYNAMGDYTGSGRGDGDSGGRGHD